MTGRTFEAFDERHAFRRLDAVSQARRLDDGDSVAYDLFGPPPRRARELCRLCGSLFVVERPVTGAIVACPRCGRVAYTVVGLV